MGNKWILATLFLAIIIGTIVSPFTSSHPDGLERVAEDHGFINLTTTLFNAPIPDYLIPGVENEVLATGLAGFLGVALTLIVTLGIGKFIAAKKRIS